ncbi:hypothetical protein ARHIZOSPH14_13930 [Agromyces rhizosphaerae]|uniref:Uncharacterized protein n=1 Tax=Agromyces rhizosphaerae TaxID=88374 RepID=A0A9W6FP40_9MICO|nr:hypothetical protein [Agromyces rhizosphaerae]GLI27151.1 hypothetical protein ARHIZOSPH14_13930 [Agromyces rhizosphaerae]
MAASDADDLTRPWGALHPERFLRPGRADAITLLVLRCLKVSFITLLFAGASLAFVTGTLTEEAILQLTSPGQFIRAALSPLIGIVAAIVIRFAVGWVALIVALPLSGRAWTRGTSAESRWRRFRDVIDVTSAYRAIRWTWAVRGAAVARAGRTGRVIAVCETVIRVANWLSPFAFIFVVYLAGTSR